MFLKCSQKVKYPQLFRANALVGVTLLGSQSNQAGCSVYYLTASLLLLVSGLSRISGIMANADLILEEALG